jgi:hypothetical protein
MPKQAPSYRAPAKGLIEQALVEAEEVTIKPVTAWRLIEIGPRRVMVVDEEETRPPKELILAMKRTPETLPPIVVERLFGGRFGLVDGRLLLEAAIQAGRKLVWAVEITGAGWPEWAPPELVLGRRGRYH